MANPTPTVNQINAFNVNVGTIINFNVIGGTDLIRSNRIYIYDINDNSLICSHLYVSTELIHELPPSTDSSIEYASGKSSNDFVNNKQYYAQIQTYTNTTGTQGASGLSIAKMFWCLVDPTLTITTIPSTISTTSYNISATYNANTSTVSNIIQQYQFSLYSATGSLLQSSGVVVGSGTQQGTSTAYDISYNFTGLSVGSSYYVVVDVTTTQGMSVTTQSNTFTVSIDTPTLGEATVVNNACDGYISVTSNLSSEYGGSGSGDIVSFETDSENVFTKLQVDLEPIQSGSGTPSPDNVRPISGHTECVTTVAGSNIYNQSIRRMPINLASGTVLYMKHNGETALNIFGLDEDGNSITLASLRPNEQSTVTLPTNITLIAISQAALDMLIARNATLMVSFSPITELEPFAPNTYTTNLGRTVYGGSLDVVSGVLTVDRAYVDLGTLTWTSETSYLSGVFRSPTSGWNPTPLFLGNLICSQYKGAKNPSFRINNGEVSMTNSQVSPILRVRDEKKTDMTASEFKTAMNGVQLVYELATPQTYQLTEQQINTLVGVNNVWSEQGDIELAYHIPITNLLVKRQDVDDVSGDWLTLYSQPVAQAGDMDFTFIDFLNQYGKTYKYALVPVIAQNQSGVIVQIEGGYTVSSNVDSIFDGVYIADQTNVERVKAGVGYGNVDMNQGVGSILPIGSKYPIVITNSQNQYHNGSIHGTIVPNDFYSNGNLSRIDMVNKRNELEQFLTNKRAKIIKDWNGNMWLVMIMSNVSCTFDDNYGMGMVSFNADWVEVGDPTNQQDLYNAGLINVGGV